MKRLLTVLCLAMALPALAYVLPGYSILRRLGDARDELKLSNLKVEGAISLFGPAAKEAASATATPLERNELPLDGVIYLKPPYRCRFEARVADEQKAASVFSGGKKRVEGTEIPTLSLALEQVCALLSGRSASENELRAKLDAHLRSLGIETQATSLARFDPEVAYVLGAKEAGKPQFWVYKTGFFPARLRWNDKAGTAWDLRLYDYASPATGEWFPRVVELFKGQELLLRFTALDGDGKTPVADKLL